MAQTGKLRLTSGRATVTGQYSTHMHQTRVHQTTARQVGVFNNVNSKKTTGGYTTTL